jgi:type I restriction enzyme S subunit
MRTPMGDILELVREPVDIDPARPYRKIGIRSFGKGIFHYDPMPGDQLGKLRFFRLRANELVLSNIKAWEGAIAVSGESDEGLVASNRFLTYRPRTAHSVDVRYLKYFLLSDPGSELIQRASPGSADRNRTLGIKAFEAIEIPLPPIEEQCAIATRLESIQVKSKAALAELNTAADLYSKLVSSLIHRPDLSEIEKNRRGWRRRVLREFVAHVDRREQIHDDDAYRVTGIYSFGKGLIDRGHIRGGDTSYQHLTPLRLNDLVMSRLNGWEGALAIVDERFAGSYVSNEYPTFEVDQQEMDLGFLSALVATPVFWKQLDDETRGSMVRRRRVHPRALLAIELWLPPTQYQAEISEQLIALRRLAQDETRREMLEALGPSAINATFAALA